MTLPRSLPQILFGNKSLSLLFSHIILSEALFSLGLCLPYFIAPLIYAQLALFNMVLVRAFFFLSRGTDTQQLLCECLLLHFESSLNSSCRLSLLFFLLPMIVSCSRKAVQSWLQNHAAYTINIGMSVTIQTGESRCYLEVNFALLCFRVFSFLLI